MKCVILQPSYIPWRGYFDQINRADVFVFYDDVQYDKHGWRNRNQIKTAQGRQWLTIPVHSHAVLEKSVPIKQVEIDWSKPWNEAHWKALTFAYGRAPFFQKYAALLESFYQRHDSYLANFTIDLTVALAGELDQGEAAAIALAAERQASLLLMDELRGRTVAKRFGIPTLGLLGILKRAKQRGLVPAIAPILDTLEQQAGFWVGTALRERVLREAGER